MAHTVIGNLDIVPIFSPQLGEIRNVRIWTPEGLDEGKPCAVFLMHDGQNLFDEATSFSGEWQADETATRFVQAYSIQPVIIGIDNSPNRFNELCPPLELSGERSALHGFCWREVIATPLGEHYADFVCTTVMELAKSRFPAMVARENTYVGGSSMGGLISLYMVSRQPELFAGAICFSPALTALTESGQRELTRAVARCASDMRLYVYVGGSGFEAEFAEPTRRLVSALGAGENICFHSEPLNEHCENVWAREFPLALKFMLID